MDLVAAKKVEADDPQLGGIEQEVDRPAEGDPVQADGQGQQGLRTDRRHG